jgi:UDP-N-acetylmuramate dehydrogenase
MDIKENVDIKEYTTFKIGGKFRYFTIISSTSGLASFCAIAQNDAKYKNMPIFIIGDGSNIVFSDGILNVLAIKIEIKGFEVIADNREYTEIKVGSGENWDSFVEHTVKMNLSGIEAMSAIPGTVGATPVQNVGAYGQETKDTLVSVDVFDIKEGIFKTLSNADCKFGYRDSIFKNEAKGRYAITAVTFHLSKHAPILPDYPGVKRYFIENDINHPTLENIRKAIIEIRRNKLPNPESIPNAGSFFKNPIVLKSVADKIQKEYGNAKFFPVDDKFTKIPAGWLIENAGLKDQSFGHISIYENNALVLTNDGEATSADVMQTRDEIIKRVFEKFGITLETEPEFVKN